MIPVHYLESNFSFDWLMKLCVFISAQALIIKQTKIHANTGQQVLHATCSVTSPLSWKYTYMYYIYLSEPTEEEKMIELVTEGMGMQTS